MTHIQRETQSHCLSQTVVLLLATISDTHYYGGEDGGQEGSRGQGEEGEGGGERETEEAERKGGEGQGKQRERRERKNGV